jgi:Fe-S-cluster-containing hydrogenase component 2
MVETGSVRQDGKAEEVAVKCDLCQGRAEGPACVSACPHGSAVRISFKDMGAVRSVLR